MIVTSKAVVLHVMKYKDSANIVDVFTESNGRVSFIVNISKSKKSRVKSNLFQPLSFLEIEWNHSAASLKKIKNVKSFMPFVSIPYDPIKTTIALFLTEFLHHVLKEEQADVSLFNYIVSSVEWLDLRKDGYSNFHLVFLMRLSRFMGLFPNIENYHDGDFFDMRNSCFTQYAPNHSNVVLPNEARHLPLLIRMKFGTMCHFVFNKEERNRLLSIINDYYRLHIPNFPQLKSIDVLREVFS